MDKKQYQLGPGRRQCVVCGEMRSAVEYVVSDTQESTRCAECRIGKEESDAARRVFKYVKDIGKSLAIRTRNAQLDVNKLHEIASGAMKKLGGLDAFVSLYATTLQSVLSDSKVSPKQKLEWLYSIVRLHESASKELQHLDQRDTDIMSIEELEQELDALVKKEIQESLKVYSDDDVA